LPATASYARDADPFDDEPASHWRLVRSLEFTSLNAIVCAEIEPERMSQPSSFS